MQLTAGTTMANYRITASLGAGGMGEVWRAEDTQLGREVALKVLPEDFSDDPERHARFEREAKVLASLNHPNIATLFGLEHLDGQHVLVMELVEGEGLDEVIARGPIGVDEAVSMAIQIAEGLEAAHEAGIVHRDLKPANIRVRPDGTVKVLDFGLAKAWETGPGDASLSMSPTMTHNQTAAGVILGTAAYMSPEQARGKAVDRRADIWAFGVVLWEMLTGTALFGGETVSDVLADVLRAEPDLEALPAKISPQVRDLVGKCLNRDPQQRLQWIGDGRLDLEAAARAPSPEPVITSRKGSMMAWMLAATGLAVGLVAGIWGVRNTDNTSFDPLHFEITDAGFSSYSNSAISPDGKTIAFFPADEQGVSLLTLRSLDTFDTRVIQGTRDGENPFFSPDGKALVFLDPIGRSVKKVLLSGGTVQTLPGIQISGYYNSGLWHPDGYLILSGAVIDGNQWPGLVTVPVNGGEPTILTTAEGDERRHHLPEVIAGSPWLLFTHQTENGHFISAVSQETGQKKIVLEGATTPRFVPPGYLFAFRPAQNDVVVMAFDASTATVGGEAVPVLGSVGTVTRGTGQYVIAENGTLIFNSSLADGVPFLSRDVVLVDRAGTPTMIEGIKSGSAWAQPRFSRDGRQLLLRRIQTPNCDLWTYDFERETTTRITFEHDTHDPLWHANGNDVLYAGDQGVRRTVFRSPADGSGSPEILIQGEISMHPASWSADGRLLALGVNDQTTGNDVWIYDPEESPEPQPFLNSRFEEIHPAFSPDGRWLAYTSDESGSSEVYVRPFPGPGGKIQISNQGGGEPLWSPDQDEIFYRSGAQVVAVEVNEVSGDLRTRPPEVLFEVLSERAAQASPDERTYDLSPDGSQFVMIHIDPKSNEYRPLKVVVGWLRSVLEKVEPG